MKTIDLDEDQIDIIIQTLSDRKNDLDIVIKEDGLEAATIRDMLIERREIDNIIRELQHYSETKK